MKDEKIINTSLCKFCHLPLEHRFIDILLPQDHSHHYSGSGESSQYLLPTFVCAHCFLVQTDEAYLQAQEAIFISSFGSSRLKDMKIYTEKVFEQFDTVDHHLVVALLKTSSVAPHPSDAVFGTSGLHTLLDMYGQADSISCHDELVYANDINDFIKALKLFLKPTGSITMEFLHLLPIFEGHSLTVSHSDRFPFLSFTSVDKMLKKYGLVIFDIAYHSGAEWLTIYIKHSENVTKHITNAVTALRGKERDFGMSSLRCYAAIKDKAMKSQSVMGDTFSNAGGFQLNPN